MEFEEETHKRVGFGRFLQKMRRSPLFAASVLRGAVAPKIILDRLRGLGFGIRFRFRV